MGRRMTLANALLLSMIFFSAIMFVLVHNFDLIPAMSYSESRGQKDTEEDNRGRMKQIPDVDSIVLQRQMEQLERSKRFARLETIRNTVYSINRPIIQPIGPPFYIYESKPRADEFNLTEAVVALNDIISRRIVESKTTNKRKDFSTETVVLYKTLWEYYFYPKIYKDNPNYVGTYLEMGALDGITGSTSLFCDKYLKWKGLLIEANPSNFAKCVINRPYAINLEMAVCQCGSSSSSSSLLQSPCQMEFIGDFGATSGAVQQMSPQNRGFFHGRRTDFYNVSCLPMSVILEQVKGFTNLDFWTLDVEGAELVTLQSVDWQKLNVWLLLIEMETNLQAVTEFLQSRGFVLKVKIGRMNQLWENPSYFTRKAALATTTTTTKEEVPN